MNRGRDEKAPPCHKKRDKDGAPDSESLLFWGCLADRATPSGDEVIAFDRVVTAVAAADDVVEIAVEGITDSDAVESRIDEAYSWLALSDKPFVNHSNEAGPLRRGKAGAAIAPAASAIVAAVLVGVGFGGDVRIVAQRGRAFVGGIDDAVEGLILGNRYSVLVNRTGAAVPSSFRFPSPAGTSGDEVCATNSNHVGIVGRPYYIAGRSGAIVAGGYKYRLPLRGHLFKDGVKGFFVIGPSPGTTDRLRGIVIGDLVEDGDVAAADINHNLAQSRGHSDGHLDIDDLLAVVAGLRRAIQGHTIERHAFNGYVERLVQVLEVGLDVADFIAGKFKESDGLAGAVQRAAAVIRRAHVTGDEISARARSGSFAASFCMGEDALRMRQRVIVEP